MDASDPRYQPVANLLVSREGIHAVDATTVAGLADLSLDLAEVLEAYIRRPTARLAFDALCRTSQVPAQSIADRIFQACDVRGAPEVLVQLAGPRITFRRGVSLAAGLRTAQDAVDFPAGRFLAPQDLTPLAAAGPRLLRTLLAALSPNARSRENPSFETFMAGTDALLERGLLSPSPRTLSFGDLLRSHPACPYFGYSRGTPIDRFYLDEFIKAHRAGIRGRTLEIGGTPASRARYGLSEVDEFVTVDGSASVGADVVGDVEDIATFPSCSFDSILAFYVLEHCEHPERVISNVHEWLKPGGTFFCVVPNTQRVHAAPKDYWRILPDGLASLFRRFADQRIEVHGNLATCIATLSGIAVEEVPRHLLGERDSRYPVTTGVLARKAH